MRWNEGSFKYQVIQKISIPVSSNIFRSSTVHILLETHHFPSPHPSCTVAPLGQSAALALGWLSKVEGTLLESTLTWSLNSEGNMKEAPLKIMKCIMLAISWVELWHWGSGTLSFPWRKDRNAKSHCEVAIPLHSASFCSSFFVIETGYYEQGIRIAVHMLSMAIREICTFRCFYFEGGPRKANFFPIQSHGFKPIDLELGNCQYMCYGQESCFVEMGHPTFNDTIQKQWEFRP